MTPDEIRNFQNGNYLRHQTEEYTALALLEIAAQLAELNENIRALKHHTFSTRVSGYVGSF